MGRIVVTEFVSLDGVMEDPGGSENFRHGGWSFEIDRGDEGDKFKLDETFASEALLLGRGLTRASPQRGRRGRASSRTSSIPCRNMSFRRLFAAPEWQNSTVLKGDLRTEVRKLKEEYDSDVVVHGSAQLVHALLEQDLVDQLRLMVFPVVLGSGKRVFGEMNDKKPLRLVDSKIVGDGVAILTYEPTR